MTCRNTQGIAAPVDFRSLDGRRSDTPQIEQREAEGRVHEAGLDVGADQHAEPDEIDAELVRHRREQRNDDEGDLEEVEEERHHEDERIGEDEEAELSAGQRGEQVLDPHLAADALEHEAEHARADQDEDHHGREAHGACHPS